MGSNLREILDNVSYPEIFVAFQKEFDRKILLGQVHSVNYFCLIGQNRTKYEYIWTCFKV
ncbi:hypothetical protein ZWY2020_026057 [Hordeum vulgare]|nr:hypothetical protein ZWY2020_026057 [Hordeum vulgare]